MGTATVVAYYLRLSKMQPRLHEHSMKYYAAAMTTSGEWVLLAYRMPREPSTPRAAVWRKLRRLGAVQVLDGLVTLPHDARTKEHLEWIAADVVAAGGQANIWLARPATKAHQRSLVSSIADQSEADYNTLIDQTNAEIETVDHIPATIKRTVSRLRRDQARIRQRDYFPGDGFDRSTSAIARLESRLDTAMEVLTSP